MTTLFTIVFLAIGLTYAATQTSFYYMRFIAGASWWLLGAWLIANPLAAGASPVNDIAVTICFLGGFGVMAWMGWQRDRAGNERFNIRIPTFLGGTSESEELAQGRGSKWNSRSSYEERLNAAKQGRRIRR